MIVNYLRSRKQPSDALVNRFAIWFLVSLYAMPVSAQSFKEDVEPLIQESCIQCHDADTESDLVFEKLDYDLTNPDTFAM